MGRSPCCSKEGLNRGAWTVFEDKILREYIKVHGEGRWRNLPKKAGLKRCGKSCRLRWLNYLRPDIKRGNITHDEEELIIRLHKLLGNRWSLIAGRLPGRTDNEIKNYWNTKIGKKVQDNQSSSTSNHKKKPTDHHQQTAAPPKMQPHVVHTKAMRCTKAFINPQPHKVDHGDTTNYPLVGPSMIQDRWINNQVVEYNGTNDGISSITSTGDDEKEAGADFLMGLNSMGFGSSDLLNYNFSDVCDFNYSNDVDNSNELSPSLSSDQPLMFPGEMLGDWTLRHGGGHQPNMNYFSSFLDSEVDWLRE